MHQLQTYREMSNRRNHVFSNVECFLIGCTRTNDSNMPDANCLALRYDVTVLGFAAHGESCYLPGRCSLRETCVPRHSAFQHFPSKSEDIEIEDYEPIYSIREPTMLELIPSRKFL